MKKRKNAPIWAKHLRRKFEIEKDLKNEAYHFLELYGLSQAFELFRLIHKGEDHHFETVMLIYQRAIEAESNARS